jgi:5-methylcytosine-specific restriction endonuclease McrA
MFSKKILTKIFERTQGHCHFCGDSLTFDRYGTTRGSNIDGAWEADHVIQKGKGGRKDASNCLPACVRCNRLRWHRKGDELRDVIFIGLIAKDEIRKKSVLGQALDQLRKKRLSLNERRRRGNIR